MSTNLNKAYSEVYEILKLLNNEYFNKVPKKFITFIEKGKDNNYIPNIKPDVPLEEQNLLQETIDILAMLKLDYWCSDENEKRELLSILEQNEQDYQKELHEKYNPDNIFKNKQKENNKINKQEEKSIAVIKKEKWYQKIFSTLKRILKIN